MNNDLESKLTDYEEWALTFGGYAPSTTERAIRRVRHSYRFPQKAEPGSQILCSVIQCACLHSVFHGF